MYARDVGDVTAFFLYSPAIHFEVPDVMLMIQPPWLTTTVTGLLKLYFGISQYLRHEKSLLLEIRSSSFNIQNDRNSNLATCGPEGIKEAKRGILNGEGRGR
jgi:hypothetical protein